MISKRLISLILMTVLLVGMMPVQAFAASNNKKPAVKPTAAPTEPPLDPEVIGYREYARRLDKTVYDKEMGAIYQPDYTIFRLWSPVASDVKVCIYKTGSDAEQGAQTLYSYPMKYAPSKGCWYLTLKGDYKNMYYTYLVTVNGMTHEVVDPYAKAVGVNGNRGMIVDLRETNPKGWSKDSFTRVSDNTRAVVWEVSVRDFSASASSGVSEKNRGKFLAFTEGKTTLNGKKDNIATCVNYLKQMGVNYVQINPFYDFASIDETDKSGESYNWGYDPKNYNAPEGSYSSNPYDGRVRIRECKQMIQALHNAGIGVIMDVVYNHTYDSEESFFHQTVPYYYHRFSETGSWSNGSGCGNDVASERYMVRRFIRDSVTYWAKEYHIDGFRFDLMGLTDVETMNSIRESLDALPDGEHILMYGEAWKLDTESDPEVLLATQDNMSELSTRIGAFNDSGRDAIKGSVFNAKEVGFVQGGSFKPGIRGMIDGDATGWASVPNQVVNYASCHDNLTLYDKLVCSVYGDDQFKSRREDLVAMNKLSAAIVMMTRGMPFILAGEEMARTKEGDENSYKSSVKVNQIDWTQLSKYPSLTEYYQGLIKLRSKLTALKDPDGVDEITYLETEGGDCLAYQAVMPRMPIVIAAFNGSSTDSSVVTLPQGDWIMLADGERAGLRSLGEYSGTVEVPHTSAVVLVNKAGYKIIGEPSDTASIYARIVDTTEKETIFEQKYNGKIGDSYTITVPDEVLFRYNLTSDESILSGKFKKDFDVVVIECEKYDGNFSSVTFRYLNDMDKPVSNAIVITNRVGQQYYSRPMPQIPGYVLDLDRLPGNGAGKYSDEPIEVTYYFKPADTIKTDAGKEYTCRANVIYMADNGDILEKKSYLGVDGDLVEVDELEFDGYTYCGKSDNYAAFSPIESNIFVNYEKKVVNMIPFYIIGGVSVMLLAAVIFYFSGRSKRKKIESIEIDE